MNEVGSPIPGVYEGVPFEEYASWSCMNFSTLKHGLRSMAHLRAAMQEPGEPTAAMRLGTMIHAAALEPLEMMNRFVVMPRFEDEIRRPDGSEYANVKATKAYKSMVADFRDEHPGKEIVTDDEFEVLKGVVASLQANERARMWLWSPGRTEVSIVWDCPKTGVRCKARIDRVVGDVLVDIKTTVDALRFETQMASLAYHMQSAFYADGWQVLTGECVQPCIVAVEKVAPFGVRAAPVSDDAVGWGREAYTRLLLKFLDCDARGEWPCYASPEYWHLPSWATADAVNDEVVELKFGGDAVAVV